MATLWVSLMSEDLFVIEQQGVFFYFNYIFMYSSVYTWAHIYAAVRRQLSEVRSLLPPHGSQ